MEGERQEVLLALERDSNLKMGAKKNHSLLGRER